MYGQMTAGSWIYIGTQGILQGTYETLAALARQHFGGTLAGRLTVTAGLGGMGGAQPLAVTMNEGVAWSSRSIRRASSGGWPRATSTRPPTRSTWRSARCRTWTDGAASRDRSRSARQRRRAAAGAGGAGRRARRAHRSDLGARRARRLRARRHVVRRRPRALRDRDPAELRAPRRSPRWAGTSRRCWRSSSAARSTFDYGNNLRAQAVEAGVADAFAIPGLRARVHPPAVLRGQGPVPLGGAVGRSGGHLRHRRGRARDVPRRRALCRWIRLAQERVAFQGLPARICWLGYGERARFGLQLQRAGSRRASVRRRSSSAAIISTAARSPRPTARPKGCATAATRSPTGRS